MWPAAGGRITARPATSVAARFALIALAIGFLALCLLLPLVAVFAEALAKGFGAYAAAIAEPDALAAIQLTLLVAAIAVPLNIVFGIAAAWAIAKFDFPGKTVLTSFIDPPFSVSPVVAGLIYVLRSEEHTSELQSLMRISYAVFCLKKKKNK